MKIVQNEDKVLVNEIRNKLKQIKEQYGKQYCPCVLPNNYKDDTVCPCKKFIESETLGECCCGLYKKIEK